MIKIMLDPGHAGNYFNASPVVAGYYESAMTWKLAQKLKTALEAYGFEVGLTRQTINEDPELTERGRRARGYDLFISLHSNAAANENPDAPWMIHFLPDGKLFVLCFFYCHNQGALPLIPDDIPLSIAYFAAIGNRILISLSRTATKSKRVP